MLKYLKIYKKYLIFLIVIPMFFGLFSSYMHKAPKRNYCDFRVYYATAQRFLEKADIYSRPDMTITPYKYSPFFAFIISFLALFPIREAAIIFFILNFFCMLFMFYLASRLVVKEKFSFSKNILLYFLTALFTMRFLLQVLNQGQVTILMCLAILLGIYFEKAKKEILSAIFFAASVMIKYTSFVFIPYLLFKKKFKLVFFIFLFISLFLILPSFYVGVKKQIYYLKKWLPFISQTSLDKSSLYDFKNQSLISLILRYFTNQTPYKTKILNFTFMEGLVISIIIGILIYILILLKPSHQDIDFALLMIFMALFNPNSWITNYTFLIFGYMIVIYWLIKNNFSDKFILSLTFLSFILASWTSQTIVGNRLENLFEEFSSVTISGLLSLLSLFKLKFNFKNKNV
ncbi:MAG: DUF2029 domain-containing protein [Candidatus Omnitrophica bacterium]|nr:DUF2029 domain-containing protein [Candidatus Omnitrophota bacterium]MCM8831941.1 DUF2029 domain-containing protein [Candidatus Omnitrophota bacterium]